MMLDFSIKTVGVCNLIKVHRKGFYAKATLTKPLAMAHSSDHFSTQTSSIHHVSFYACFQALCSSYAESQRILL